MRSSVIYIPLWSYSNRYRRRYWRSRKWFTFHYGPIQILYNLLTLHLYHIYIPLWSYSNIVEADDNGRNERIYIPLWSYSNEAEVRAFADWIRFTFHYGPIQMRRISQLCRWMAIYIPLWSYSNDEEKKFVSRAY